MTSGEDPLPPSLPDHAPGRLVHRLRTGYARLRTPPTGDARVWITPMSVILLGATLLTIGLLYFDGAINAAVRQADTPLRGFLRDWTDIARSQWYLVPAGVLILFAGMVDWGKPDSTGQRVWSNLYGQAVFVFVAVGGAQLLTTLLKIVFGRARPPLYGDVGPYAFEPFRFGNDFASFPSGHSTTAGAVTMILMLWLPRFRLLFLAVGLALGASRSAAEAHYPSDIVAGLTIGLFFTLTLARWLGTRARSPSASGPDI